MTELACTAKLSFPTKKDAVGAAAVAGWRYGSKLKVYSCRLCGQWHIASHYTD